MKKILFTLLIILSTQQLFSQEPTEKENRMQWFEDAKLGIGQLEELSKQFKPDLYWFDGDWEQSAEKWKAKELSESLHCWNKNVILNSRIQGYGDYATPEQGLPITRPESRYW